MTAKEARNVTAISWSELMISVQDHTAIPPTFKVGESRSAFAARTLTTLGERMSLPARTLHSGSAVAVLTGRSSMT